MKNINDILQNINQAALSVVSWNDSRFEANGTTNSDVTLTDFNHDTFDMSISDGSSYKNNIDYETNSGPEESTNNVDATDLTTDFSTTTSKTTSTITNTTNSTTTSSTSTSFINGIN